MATSNDPSLFCLAHSSHCYLASEWAVFMQLAVSAFTVVVGVIGVYKVFKELERMNEQRAKELADKETTARLKRTEFMLAQHRRLFDNPDLFAILSLIDDDDDELILEENWNKKRKFLTFFEEIKLLIASGQLDPSASYYMFGYYAERARFGDNFKVGIDVSPVHWRLFYQFADEAAEYRAKFPDGPSNLSL